MEWLRRAEESGVDSGAQPSRPSSRAQCRAAACTSKINDLKAKVKALEAELRPLTRMFKIEVEGQVRVVHAELALVQGQRDDALAAERATMRKRNDAFKAARELAVENEQLLSKVAALSCSYASLIGKHASREKKAMADSRQAAQRERKLLAVVARLEAKAEVAEQRKDEAEEAEHEAEERAAAAEQRVLEAEAIADEAVAESEAAAADAEEARREVSDGDYLRVILSARLKRVEAKAADKAAKLLAQNNELMKGPRDRTVDEWAALNKESEWKAAQRERLYLSEFLTSHDFRAKDVADALDELGLVESLFKTQPFFTVHFGRVKELVEDMEQNHFGEVFGMYLHYEMNLTFDKIVRLTQAACKKFDKPLDRYCSKVLLYNPYVKGEVVKVPRLAPPMHKMAASKKAIEATLNVQSSEEGLIAFVPIHDVIHQLLRRDPGTGARDGHCMPPLSHFVGAAKLKLPLVIHFDGTGYGKGQFNTLALNNPYTSQSAQSLYVFGLGNCNDDRSGSTRVFGPNLPTINTMMREPDECIVCPEGNVTPEIFTCLDVAALRHTEHLANSGWCGCSRDVALRQLPKKPQSVSEMYTLLEQCHELTVEERFVLSHMPVPGEDLPRPCTVPGCTFAHNRSTAAQELQALLHEEAELCKVDTKAGKAAFSRWRMAHAHAHRNVQPGEYGKPMLHVNFTNVILDALHMAELNLPKLPFKHAILNNASDDAREAISQLLNQWRHPLDTRRKDDNRQRAQKWFTGEKWHSFCAGTAGSPGGPVAIATLVLLMAQDMQLRGTPAADAAAPAAPAAAAAAPPPRSAGRGRGMLTAGRTTTPAAAVPLTATRAEATREPTALERAADPADLAIIRELFGSRAETIINSLLSFDGFFIWYFNLKESVEHDAPLSEKEAHALKNCQAAIDMMEIFERSSIRKHGSFMPHGAIFKTTRDIIKVGDIWRYCLSALELQNAETKRVAKSGGSCRQKMSTSSQTRRGLLGTISSTVGYATTQCISTLRKLLGAATLRRGDGVIALPESRRRERLLGVGRTKLASKWVKSEVLHSDYNPRLDTCIKAFVRALAAQNTPEQ